LGKFWRAMEWKRLVDSMPIWNIHNGHFVYFRAIFYFSYNLVYFPPILVYCFKKNLATLTRQKGSRWKYKTALPNSVETASKLKLESNGSGYTLCMYMQGDKIVRIVFLRRSVIPFPIGFCYRQSAILL
jgi:hypothetical protein